MRLNLNVQTDSAPGRESGQAVRTDRPAIAVVGLGPRGMVIVERLVAQLRARPDVAVDLLLFDTRKPGAGLHQPDLPDHLLLNTVAGQLSFWPHPDAVSGTAPHRGPTLYQWCLEKDIRISARGALSADPGARCVAAGDYLPRRVLGAYMQHQAQALLANLPDNIRLRHVAEEVVDALSSEASGRQCLVTTSGDRYWTDALFCALGHPHAVPRAQPYVRTGETVAIAGLGLTAIDQVAALTKGRGGLFAGDVEALRYVRSGREPRILLASRSGLPYLTRPDWQPQDDRLKVPPIFLTRCAVDRLRRETPDTGERLCFRSQLLPLLRLDMYAAYHITRRRLDAGPGAAEALLQAMILLADIPGIAERVFAGLETQLGASGIERLLDTEPRPSGRDSRFSQLYQRLLREDLAQSRLGASGSPIKAAAEVWRNQRDVLRYAVNGEGLTDASREEFYRVYAPLSNRLVGGPQKERHAELLALCEAGVVTLLPPGSLSGGVVRDQDSSEEMRIECRLPAFVTCAGASRMDSTLVRNLLEAGRVRPVARGLDGLDVDAHGHPRDTSGRVDTTIWLVGPPVEGASFYNHYVGTPAPDCPLFVDAEREVRRCIDCLSPMPARAGVSLVKTAVLP